MKARYIWKSICLLVTLTMVEGQQTPIQSCHASSKDTQCLIDYIAYQRAPEQHLLQLIHSDTKRVQEDTRGLHEDTRELHEGTRDVLAELIRSETRQLSDDTRQMLVDMSQRLESLQRPSTGLMTPDPTVPNAIPESTNAPAPSHVRPRDCRDIQLMGNSISGVYTIYPFLLDEPLDVYCDLYEDGGGWIVFQRRRDGSVNFTRTWPDYKNGFGGPDVHEELWVGNKYIHAISDYTTQELRVELGAWDGSRAYAKYTRFHVSSEDDQYRLYLGTYSGDAGNAMVFQNNRKFSTPDRDNDSVDGSCALTYSAGFWFGGCTNTNINGPYRYNSTVKNRAYGITWLDWKGDRYSLKFTEMKIRPLPYG